MPAVAGSASTSELSVGTSRKFSFASLTTRTRSAAGLKSKPYSVPVSDSPNVLVPTGVATPPTVSIV